MEELKFKFTPIRKIIKNHPVINSLKDNLRKYELFKFLDEGSYIVFNSLVPYQNKYLAVFRQFKLSNFYDSYLYSYCLDKDYKQITPFEKLTEGEDPRVFLFNNKPYALCFLYFPEKKDTEMFLFDIEGKRKIKLSIKGGSFTGKNWVPFVYKSKLHFIYSLEPLNILSCDISTGECDWVFRTDKEIFKKFKFHRDHSSFGGKRGGTQGEVIDGKYIVGFAHETFPAPPKQLLHIPFMYILNMENFKIKYFYPEKLNKKGLIDPNSFWFVGDDIHLSITRSEMAWFYNQRIDIIVALFKDGKKIVNELIKAGQF